MIVKKKITFGREAQSKLLNGVNTLANAVGSTLGPKGRMVAYNSSPGYDVAPMVLRDGVSVARNINLEDPEEDMGARILKQAAIRTVEQAGDGTTLTTILAQEIVNRAIQNITAGANPMTIKKEIEADRDAILIELKELAKEVKSDAEFEQIATISASDLDIGKLVAEAFKKVGKDGTITTERSKGIDTTVDYQQGIEIDRGMLSPYFINKQGRVEAEIDDPYILITDKKLNNAQDLIPFINTLIPTSKNIVIFAGEVIESAMSLLVENKIRGIINVVAVQAPAYGGRRVDELEDLAVLTGGVALLEDSGRDLKSVTISELGRATKVISDRDKTIVLGGKGNADALKIRMDELREQLTVANTDYDRDIKAQRLAKLAGGVAVINVGAATDIEADEKKERVIDAVNAVKSASEEGVVAGGEITLLKIAGMDKNPSILRQALAVPFKRLTENAGMDYGNTRELMAGSIYPDGIDIIDGKVKNLIKAGVIDPAKVLRCAIENAVSVASMIITTNTIINEVEPKE